MGEWIEAGMGPEFLREETACPPADGHADAHAHGDGADAAQASSRTEGAAPFLFRRKSPAAWTLSAPDGTEVASGSVEMDATGMVRHTATETGRYLLEVKTNAIWTTEIDEPAGAGFLASEEVPMHVIGEASLGYIAVPEGAERFQVRVDPTGPWEPVGLRLVRPDGSVALEREGVWEGYWRTIRVLEGQHGVWRLDISLKEDGILRLRGPITPCISVSPERCLVPGK